MSDLISCPQCQRVFLPGDRFCAGCGVALVGSSDTHTSPTQISRLHRIFSYIKRPLWWWRLFMGVVLASVGMWIGALLAHSGYAPGWLTPASAPSAQSEQASSPSGIPYLKHVDATRNSAEKKLSHQAPVRWQVTTDLLNLRERPSLTAQVVLRVKQGAEFEGTGRRVQAEGHDWVELKIAENRHAWGSARLMQALSPKQKPVASTSVMASPSPGGRLLNREKLSGWLKGTPSDRRRTALAMTRLMFPQENTELLNQKAALLEACITGSAQDPAIRHHEVAEISAICALLLGWQEKTSPAVGNTP